MMMEYKNKVISVYDKMCRSRGEKVTLPQPFHTCAEKCRMVEVACFKNEVFFVCAWSRNVHACGKRCTMGERLKDNSGYVCPLTGFVLPGKIFTHYITTSKENPKKRIGDNNISMDRKPRRRRTGSTTNTGEKIVNIITKTLRTIMTGKAREEIHREAMTRFRKEVRQSFRSEFAQGGKIDYARGMQIIRRIKEGFHRSLNKPAVIDDETLSRIARKIAEYFHRLRPHTSGLNNTINSIEIFTACMVDKLASGFVLNGVDIVPRIRFFARHAPEEIQFGMLPNIRCRAMSICHRQIQSACITKNGNVRVDLKFSLGVSAGRGTT